MTFFKVEVRTTGREVYSVEADSADEAEETWFDGSLVDSEVLDYEVDEIWEEEEES